MLTELTIHNFAIIRDLHVTFAPGLNALTGETGAGKSIIIDALGAVLGARASADFVRSGEPAAWIEAIFDVGDVAKRPELAAALGELGIEPDGGMLILSREIRSNGRSTARINGHAVTTSGLGTIGSLLVDIHGQSEHLSLLRPALHLDMLDHYAGTFGPRARLAELVRRYQDVHAQIETILTGERDRAQRIDLLRFQVEEIEAAALQPGEEDALERERVILANAEGLALLAAEGYALLEGGDPSSAEPVPGALDVVGLALGRFEEIARLDSSVEPLAERLRDLQAMLEDIARDARSYRDQLEANPARLAEVEDRIALLRRLTRKYGATVEEVIAFGKQAAEELSELETSETRVEELREAEDRLLGEIAQEAVALSARRREAARALEHDVEQAIAELRMGRARFVVSFGPLSSRQTVPVSLNGSEHDVPFDATGIDRVEFLIAPNAGEEPRPLARIASGGETARLMLALKSILSAADATPTLIFDEVDVGVGGRSGQAVGEKLWSLSDRHQVIVISHLPQIAAFAGAHYRITKLEHDGRTETRVDLLNDAERIDELAAMLDGQPVTVASRENARVMLERVHQWQRETAARLTAV